MNGCVTLSAGMNQSSSLDHAGPRIPSRSVVSMWGKDSSRKWVRERILAPADKTMVSESG